MVKCLADELTDILNWIENPSLGEHAHEKANMGLVCFCRGLVCGLRADRVQIEISEADRRANAERRQKPAADCRRNQENAQRNESKYDPEAAQRLFDSITKVDVGFRGGLRPTDEDMRVRPSIGEALKDPGCVPDCH